MKIGILTFHAAYNYGSILQAFALQSVLQQLGHEVEIINFRSDAQKMMYRSPLTILRPRAIMSDIKRILLSTGNEFRKCTSQKIFEKFISEHYNLSVLCTSEEEVKKISRDYDIIILGSDQIWNQNIIDHSVIYYGSGLAPKRGLISYAVSMGPCPTANNPQIIQELLGNIQFISVREESAANYIKSLVGRQDISVCLDPTLLLPAESYQKLLIRNKNNKIRKQKKNPYLYYYTPGKHPEILSVAKSVGNLLELPLLIDTGYFIEKGNNLKKPMGPIQFLNNIKDAELVIGSSFHLIVFAILFHKDFLCINPYQDARMQNLLSYLGLSDRIICQNSLTKELYSNIRKIDWNEVETRRNGIRDYSINFLKTALDIVRE